VRGVDNRAGARRAVLGSIEMPKILSSSAKLRLEKTTSGSSSPLHHHQQHHQQKQQKSTSKLITNGPGAGGTKMKKKSSASSPKQQKHGQQQQQPRRQQHASSLLSLSRAPSETAPQRQRRQVTDESSPSPLLPSKPLKKRALENKESSTKQTPASAAAAAAAAVAVVAATTGAATIATDVAASISATATTGKATAAAISAAAAAPLKHRMKLKNPPPAAAAATIVESSSTVASATAKGDLSTSTGTTATITNNKKSLKRKRNTDSVATASTATASHPFRIKVKCVVALRMQPQGNHVVQIIRQRQQQQHQSGQSEQEQQQQQQQQFEELEVPIFPSPNFVHVWTNPLAGRDEGLALIGKRIRCFFPKNLIQQQQQQQQGNNKQRRVLEGEVVSVQASSSFSSSSSSSSSSGKGKRNNASTTTIHHFPPWKVELLVDKTMLDHFSFLIQTNKQDEQGVNTNSNNNKTHARNSRLEQIIRGESKVTVKMRLQNASEESSSCTKNCVKWVIQKRVPSKLFKSLRTQNNSNSSDDVVSVPQDATALAANGKIGHALTASATAAGASAGNQSNPTSGDATRTVTDDPSSSHSPLAARTLNGKGNKIKTNGVHNNVPQTTMSVAATVASSSTTPAPEAPSSPVKKRRKFSATENNNNKTIIGNAVVIKHVGDGNDSADQQVANWRWLASRYHDFMLLLQQHQQQQHSPSTSDEIASGQALPPPSSPPLSTTLAATAATATAEILSAGLVGEVVKIEATSSLSSLSSSSLPMSSLAFVTIRRLVLPEFTASGRLPHHGLYDIFNVHDDNISNNGDDEEDIFSKAEPVARRQQEHFFRIPVEELVVICRTIKNELAGDQNRRQQFELYRTHGYSLSHDTYTALEPSKMPSTTSAAGADEEMEMTETDGNEQMSKVCHLCRRLFCGAEAAKSGVECNSTYCPVARRQGRASGTFWCNSCVQSSPLPWFCNNARRGGGGASSSSSCLPCCARVCDCRDCLRWIGSNLHQNLYQAAMDASTEIETRASSSSHKNGNGGGFFSLAQHVVERVGTIDFGIPHDFLDLSSLPAPAAKPMARIKTRKAKQWKNGVTSNASGKKRNVERADGRDGEPIQLHQRREPDDYSVFKPTCARLLTYGEMKRLRQDCDDSYVAPTTAISTDRPRNLRQANKQDDDDEKDGNKTTESRAARVKQRRLLKSVAGIQSFEVDTLAGRESQLRFGRSGIHAWGVYADADITAGDMIVEYRGELIENAMAEKREKEYEAAKIGSDYMFRLDKDTVCDATKVGNVARFINASCDPNCYTKIITVGSDKRIVIYAKRDISAGQELCYDYKFPLEYDESKRIPCHCGARNCRGFMNWDKRYVSVSAPEEDDERKPAATCTEPEQHDSITKE
jgi:SET domain